MSESQKLHFDTKSPAGSSTSSSAHKTVPSTSLQQQYPVRRMRNTAVLVKWIEEHQSNPYPTKAEKQYLAYYSGMNLTQLSTWFANARRRIKKIGMKTWLEGRSTFTVDFFPSAQATAFSTSRPTGYSAEYIHGGSYNAASSNPYAAMQYATLGNHTANQQSPAALGLHAGATLSSNPYSTEIPSRSSSLQSSLQPTAGANYSIYASTTRSSLTNQFIGVPAFTNWSSTAPALLSTSTQSSRPSSNTGPTLHSPLTAQVYSTDPNASMRSQATLDMSENGPYALSQPSPDQMLPECASAEPMLQGSSPKTHYSVQAD